jgi:hypothetical protein
MASNRLSYIAVSALSLFLLGCPAPVDNEMTGGSGGNSSGGTSGSGGRGGSGSGGSAGGSSGGSNASGGSSGGSSASGGSGGSGSGGSGSGGSGSGGSGGSGSGGSGSGGSTGGSSGSGGSGGSGGGTGGAGGGMTDARAEAPAANGTKVPPEVQAVFMKCGTACHGGNWGDATKSYARLKMNAMCGNMPRMAVNDGANSLVIKKMKGAVPNCGARMPLNMPMLPATDIMTVETWITMGAKPVP